MAIGLTNALSGFAPLETPRPVPRVAVDALVQLQGDALRTVVAAAAARTLASAGDATIEGDPQSMDHLSEATAAVACVLVHCARELAPGTSPSTLRQAIADCGVDDGPLVARLVPLLSPHIPPLRAALRATSFDFAHVVDVRWRLDYVLRSSAEGNVHEPVYFVQLTIQPPQGPVRDITFSCSVEGLRDLVYRLQDATNTIEKIASAKTTTTAAVA